MKTRLESNYIVLYLLVLLTSCTNINSQTIKVGAECTEEYIPTLINKNVGIVVNHTSQIKETHLVDSLLQLGIKVTKIFAPEHGFRGNADAGETVNNGKDQKTGIPIVSLYGKNKKPKAEQLKDIEYLIFDIQDVGVRFYTYISTMHYVMEACAENNIPLLILDRPNPNGHYIDGPVLDPEFKSFVGMHPIPVVHGLTVGELAQMINGENWLKNNNKCDIHIVTVKHWDHQTHYSLPIKPSPNLPNDKAINAYPSLCFFEPTTISIGRGTQFPFQVIGSTKQREYTFTFTPTSINGMSKHPKHENTKLYGIDLRNTPQIDEINLSYLTIFYNECDDKENFFTNERFFNLLAGNNKLIEQVRSQTPPEEIRESWQSDLNSYLKIRSKYTIYD